MAMQSHLQSGKYEIIREVAQGGMGKIYLATHTMMNRQVAIKALHTQYSSDQAFIERFLREARAMAQLDHPNIISVHDVFEDDKNFYIIMEFCNGKSLDAKLKEAGGTLPVKEALSITLQTARGLSYAHLQGIVHRDIKPANIMVEDDGRVKLTDFGIAAAKNLSGLTATGQVIGSPQYMSPEQAGGGELDGRSDLYSLGMVLYKILTGKTPLEGQSLISIMGKLVYQAEDLEYIYPDHIPQDVIKLVEDMVAREPVDRVGSAQELIARIIQVMEGTSSSQIPADNGEKTEFISIDEDDISGVFSSNTATVLGEPESKRSQPVIAKPGQSQKNMYMAGGALAVVVILAGIIWAVSDDSTPTPSVAKSSDASITTPEPPVAQEKTDTGPPQELQTLITSITELNKQVTQQYSEANQLVQEKLLTTEELAPNEKLKAEGLAKHQQAMNLVGEKKYDEALFAARESRSLLQKADIEYATLIRTARLVSNIGNLYAESDKIEELYNKVKATRREALDKEARTYADTSLQEAQKLEQGGLKKLQDARKAISSRQHEKAKTLLLEAGDVANKAIGEYQIATRLATESAARAKVKKLRTEVAALVSKVQKARNAAKKSKAQTLASSQYKKATKLESSALAKQQQASQLSKNGNQEKATRVFQEAKNSLKQAASSFLQAQNKAKQVSAAAKKPAKPVSINDKLAAFLKAYDKMDLAQLERMSNMSPRRRAILVQLFKNYKDIEVQVDGFSENNDTAEAKVTIKRLIDNAGNQVVLNDSVTKASVIIKKENGFWGKINW